MIIQNIENLTWLIQGNTTQVSRATLRSAGESEIGGVWHSVDVVSYTVTVWHGDSLDMVYNAKTDTLEHARELLTKFIGKLIAGEITLP